MIHYSSFGSYLKHPTPVKENAIEVRGVNIFLIPLLCYLSMLALVVGVGFFTVVPLKLFQLVPERNPVLLTPINLVYIILIGPIVEELIFRLPLRFKPIYIIISIALLIFLINKSQLPKAFILCAIWCAVGTFVLYYKKFNVSQFLENIWENHFPFVFYFYAIGFGLIHITNFVHITPIQYLLAPLITMPQLIAGLCLSYVRLTYDKGLVMAMLIHILLNGGTCLLLLAGGVKQIL